MKHLIAIIAAFAFFTSVKAQTFSCASNFTCYHLDSSNVHCYVEDSEADLDLNNDGVMDREYIFSTPPMNESLKNRNLKEDHGVIRNRNSEQWEDVGNSEGQIEKESPAGDIKKEDDSI